jgi:hypothetical protein
VVTAASGHRFAIGAAVRVKTDVPGGNPRTPPYARGRRGVVVAAHGTMANPLDHREPYPPLYTVAFDVREAFPGGGDGKLYVDIHEEWLEPA